MPKINIVGILVRAFPEQLNTIEEQIRSLGAEVHLRDRQGKLVVTMEEENDAVIADTLVKFQQINGIISATLVYHGIDESEQI